MAFPKHGKQERRMPAYYVMVTGAVFIAFFLVAVWVFSAPSEVPEEIPVSDVAKKNNESPSDGSSTETQQAFESTSADLPPVTKDENTTEDSEERLSDNGEEKTNSESSSLDRSETEEDTQKKSSDQDNTSDEDPSANKSEPEEKAAEEMEEPTTEEKKPEEKKDDDLPAVGAVQADLTTENKEGASSWDTQAKESKTEKDLTDSETSSDSESEKEAGSDQAASSEAEEKKNGEEEGQQQQQEEESSLAAATVEEVVDETKAENGAGGRVEKYEWKSCSFDGAQDYIPCLDNKEYLLHMATRKHYEHRERHCPDHKDVPKCLVPLPPGYKTHIPWPASRDAIWYNNVPHEGLASYKADQNWVKKQNDKLLFPGGGTQFKDGVEHYIEYLEKILPEISWGKHTRVLLDVGCGVASFGGYLFNRDVIAMSFAPKDEHEAQVQMALERGIPAVSSVMGTQRLVYPTNVFDIVHCARCRVPWHLDGGLLLLELNRILRPGGLFVWSATPVYQDTEDERKTWNDTIAVTESMAWKMLVKNTDHATGIGAAIFQKPMDNKLYEAREQDSPPMCPEFDNPDAAWYVRMKPCIHRIPTTAHSKWPAEWPLRLNSTPASLSKSDEGLYGHAAPDDFEADTAHWENVVQKSYLTGLDIEWSNIRNVMDMKADYGGFAAALISQPVWVMNIVPTNVPDMLRVIFDRGLIGMYHDWCEPHSTYPRSYDLLHANHLLGSIDKKCSLENLVIEMDRILRPDGWAIFRDEAEVLKKVQEMVTSLHWNVQLMYTKKGEELLAAQKRFWRPEPST